MSTMNKNSTTGKYELELTPSASAQTKTIKVSGTYCDTDIDVKVSTDANLIAENIKNGVTIFGVVGSLVDYALYDDINVPNATSSEIRSGYEAYTPSGSKIVGTMADTTYSSGSSSNSGTLQATITPSTSDQYVNIAAGYTPKSYVKINAMNEAIYARADVQNTGTQQIIITPSTSTQYVTITAGYTPESYIKINAMTRVYPTYTGGIPSVTDASNVVSVAGMSTLASGTSSYYIDACATLKATRTDVTYADTYLGYIYRTSGTIASAAQTETSPTVINSNRVYIPAATWGTSSSGTLENTITPTCTSSSYINITEGYTPAKYIKINPATPEIFNSSSISNNNDVGYVSLTTGNELTIKGILSCTATSENDTYRITSCDDLSESNTTITRYFMNIGNSRMVLKLKNSTDATSTYNFTSNLRLKVVFSQTRQYSGGSWNTKYSCNVYSASYNSTTWTSRLQLVNSDSFIYMYFYKYNSTSYQGVMAEIFYEE